MKLAPTFPAEFFEHLDRCNRSEWPNPVKRTWETYLTWQPHSRFREVFFSLKAAFLRRYAEADGHDYQRYRQYTYFIRDCTRKVYPTRFKFDWDEVPGESFGYWEYDVEEDKEYFCFYDYDSEAEGCVGIRWCSDHEHVLERYKLRCTDGSERVYHLPGQAHRYRNYKGVDRESEGFEELVTTARDVLGKPKERSDDGLPLDSLKWLVTWYAEQVVPWEQELGEGWEP